MIDNTRAVGNRPVPSARDGASREESKMRSAIAATALILGVASPAHSFEWRAEVSHCEPTRGKLIARHLQCELDPVVAPCGKIQAVSEDLGGLARFEVLWQSGTTSEVLIGPHEDQLCILATRFISGGSLASAE
jgi:hypothetical protein